MKIIEIKDCGDCLYRMGYDAKGGYVEYCSLHKMGETIHDIHSIPDWCPLPDGVLVIVTNGG